METHQVIVQLENGCDAGSCIDLLHRMTRLPVDRCEFLVDHAIETGEPFMINVTSERKLFDIWADLEAPGFIIKPDPAALRATIGEFLDTSITYAKWLEDDELLDRLYSVHNWNEGA